MLNVNLIDVFYGELQALWGISLEVREGEMVSLVGANGAGKTTVIRSIMGHIRPRRGMIEFQDERIDQIPAYKMPEKGLALVPEGRRLFSRMSVLDNLRIGAYSRAAREKFDESLEKVYRLFPRLEERAGQRAGTLSGGEQQMLSISRALMSCPRLLIADELTLGLAPNLADEVIGTLESLHREGLAILLVEQNAKRALETSDRSYVLENGRIGLSGNSKELLGNPAIKKTYLGL